MTVLLKASQYIYSLCFIVSIQAMTVSQAFLGLGNRGRIYLSDILQILNFGLSSILMASLGYGFGLPNATSTYMAKVTHSSHVDSRYPQWDKNGTLYLWCLLSKQKKTRQQSIILYEFTYL